jgi:DNA polymerase-1
MNLFEKYKQFDKNKDDITIYSSLNDNVLFVDGHNLYIRSFAATPTMNDDGQHVGGITGFLKSLGAFIRLYKPSRVVCVFDGRGGSDFRRKIHDTYKSGRRSMTRLNRTYNFLTIDQEQESMRWQILKLIAILKCLPITILSIDEVEADDVIAYLAKHIEGKNGKSIILSTDKDFLQLVNTSISVWNPIKKKMYTPELVLEEYGIHPNNFLFYRILNGDDSDNIKGVNGAGSKTVKKLFPELAQSNKISLTELLHFAEQQLKYVVAKRISESKDILTRNIQLMNLETVQISAPIKISILNQFDTPLSKLNKLDLTKIFTQDKLHRAFPTFDMWVVSTFIPLTRFSLND